MRLPRRQKQGLVVILAGLLASGAQAQTAGQQLIINGQPTELKSCLPLPTLRTITLPRLAGDSLAVELYLIRGKRPFGRNYFPSVEAFNTYASLAWLNLQLPTNEQYLKDRRALAPLAPVMAGDRVLILVGKGSNLPENGFRYSYNLPLCPD